MLIIRLPILPVLISCVAAMCLSGCGEHDKSAAEEAPLRLSALFRRGRSLLARMRPNSNRCR